MIPKNNKVSNMKFCNLSKKSTKFDVREPCREKASQRGYSIRILLIVFPWMSTNPLQILRYIHSSQMTYDGIYKH